MSDRRIEQLREIYADWGRGDYSRSDYLHPEMELVFGSDFLDAGSFKGQAAVAEGWSSWLRSWSFWSAKAVDYIDLGEHVLVAIETHGVAKTTGLDLTVQQPSANLWEFRDGLPFRVTLYTRIERAYRDLGLESP